MYRIEPRDGSVAVVITVAVEPSDISVIRCSDALSLCSLNSRVGR